MDIIELRPALPDLLAIYDRMHPAIERVPEAALRPVNADPYQVVARALRAVPNLRDLRPRMERELPLVDFAKIDSIEDLAHALLYIHQRVEGGTHVAPIVRAQLAPARKLRNRLLRDAEALAEREVFDASAVAKIERGVGYRNVAEALSDLASMFRAGLELIAGRCSVTLDELDRAERYALLFFDSQLEGQRPATQRERQQALTLLVEAYGEARRAVTYLRWNEGDAARLVPALFTRTSRRPSADDDASDGEDDTDASDGADVTTPSVTVPNNGGGPFIR